MKETQMVAVGTSGAKVGKFRNLCRQDKIFYIIIYFIIAILLIITIYPLYFIIIASISDIDAIFNGDVFLYPVGINFKGYEKLLENKLIWSGYRNTIIYTLLGTAINIAITIPAGWGLSRSKLPAKKGLMWFFIFTMFFSGGLIPFYLLISNLGWIGKPISLIIPSAVSVWNVFMTKTFFASSVPSEMLEAAEIDGAGIFRVFVKIVIPISTPIIAVMTLYYAVGHWNSYFSALIFISDEKLFPLQLVLREILITAENSGGGSSETILEQAKLANAIKYSSIIVSTLPIIVLYPLVSKYFEKGIMVGSLKA